ncbi:MAG: hypothetical protein JWR21_3304 [Herminiimonas sp.]|nr:hypothetical protein [Herminiimonas sp.]
MRPDPSFKSSMLEWVLQFQRRDYIHEWPGARHAAIA